MHKLSLELELTRHQAEKWDSTREERKSEFDSRRSVILLLHCLLHPLTRIAEKVRHQEYCSLKVNSQKKRQARLWKGTRWKSPWRR